MKSTETQTLPAPPSLVASLLAGFDTVTAQLGLIIFPLALDLFLWFGPRLSLAKLIQGFLDQMPALAGPQPPEIAEMTNTSSQLWRELTGRMSLLPALRSLPVGIPSLMAGRQPVESPAGALAVIDVGSVLAALGLWLLLTVIGLVAGALYFRVVSQAALTGKVDWRAALTTWPWAAQQVVALALLWAGLLLLVSLPAVCLLSVFSLAGLGGAPLGGMLYGFALLWVFFPLFLSPHGIFVNRRPMWFSVRDSLRLTRLTLPQTMLFFGIIFVLSWGLDRLWQVPPENSWFGLIGIGGHGFVVTGLLAASFIYYRDADRWVQRMLQQLRLAGTHRI